MPMRPSAIPFHRSREIWPKVLAPLSLRAEEVIAKFDLDAVRGSLPVTQRVVYLNTGTAGPLPAPAVAAMAEAAKLEAETGRIGHAGFQDLFDRLTDLRAGLAAFVGAEPLEIAVSHNT